MEKKIIELAKESYKARKQIKRLSVKKVFMKGLDRHSDVLFIANGKKVALTKFGHKDYDFIVL